MHKTPINWYPVNLLAFYCEQEAYEYDTGRFISGIVQEDAYLGNVADEWSTMATVSQFLVKINCLWLDSR